METMRFYNINYQKKIQLLNYNGIKLLNYDNFILYTIIYFKLN